MAYAMAGDPDLARSVDVFAAMVEGGADVLEIGVAFSDPIADGPVIQAASERALKAGATLRGVLDEVVPEVRRRCPETPLVVMTYVNVVMAMGEERYAKLARERGSSGTILPDLPPEESAGIRAAFDAEGVDAHPPVCAHHAARAGREHREGRAGLRLLRVGGGRDGHARGAARQPVRATGVGAACLAGAGGGGLRHLHRGACPGGGSPRGRVVVGSAIVRAAQADGPVAAAAGVRGDQARPPALKALVRWMDIRAATDGRGMGTHLPAIEPVGTPAARVGDGHR